MFFQSRFKTFMQFVLVLSILLFASFLAAKESHAAGAKIPVIGKSADGKYPVYDLRGDLQDFDYFSPGTKWTPNDLLTRMVFLDPRDVNNGKYKCAWICKDGFQNVVGLNPATRQFLPRNR